MAEQRTARLTAEELVARHKRLPRIDFSQMRADIDEFFGTEDRVGDPDPDVRPG